MNHPSVSGPTLDLESAIAAILDRRAKNRLKGPYRPRDKAEIQRLLQTYVADQPGYAEARILNVDRLSGGASKEQFATSLIEGGRRSESYSSVRWRNVWIVREQRRPSGRLSRGTDAHWS